jgi:hypothetical protein
MQEVMVRNFDSDFVAYWSDRYVAEEMKNDRERRLFEETGPAASVRGYLTAHELTEIGRWKSRRSMGYLVKNTPTLVEDITCLAFAPATPHYLRHRILCLLEGVQPAVASAILTIWSSDKYTVLDYRAVDALQMLEKRGLLHGLTVPPGGRGNLPAYYTYLQVCRVAAEHVGVSLRSLDRALWKWHQAGMPEDW